MMKVILTCLLVSSALFSQGKQDEPVTVDFVNLQKYIGKWYEIAKLPNWFQKSCMKGTTAEYSIDEDGDIVVKNTCYESGNSINTTTGLAKIVDAKTNAKLKVSFVNILGIRLFWGDYWILGLGQNYEYAVVGTGNRKYAWILSRTKTLEKEKTDEALNILKKNGFDVSKIEYTQQ
jgi:apolipoprotein D and lipocalin family protein